MRTSISNVNPITATKIRIFTKTFGNVFLILVAAILGAAPAAAANNIVVVRVGDGVQPMNSGVGNSLFLDEFTTSGIIQGTVPIPSSGTNALIADASTTQQSPELWTSLRLSLNGQYLIFPGFNVSYPSSQGLSSANASVVPRGIGRVDANGVYTLAVSDSGLYNATTFRSVVSSDGFSQFWTSGGARGVKYLNPPNSDVQVSPINGAPGMGNVRDLGIFNDALYASTQAGTNYGLYVFDGVPTSADNPSFLLSYNPTNSHPDEFAVSPDGQTIYLADDGVNGVGGGIERWDFNGFGWNVSYILSTGDILGSIPVGARGLAVDFSNFTGGGTNRVGAVIYATTAELTGNRLISIADYGPASSAVILSVLNTTNQVYRGVSFWPSSSATNSCLTLSCRNLVVYSCTCTNVAFTNAVSYSDPCCSNNVTVVFNYPITNCFQVNTTNIVNVVVYDNCGNVVSNSFTVTVLPYSVTVVVPAGSQSLLSNPLNNGNNAANILFPNPDPGQDYTGPRDFDELEVYQCPTNGQSVGTFELFFFDSVTSDTSTGFLDVNDNPVAAPILNPGCGFIYLNQQGVNETDVFTGCPGTPGACICGCNQWSFLGPVGIAPTGSYQGITGSAPINGSQVSFSPPGSGGTNTDIYSNGTWSPATPVVTNGEAAFFYIPCCLTLTNIVNGTNKIYSCGTTNWSFDNPQPVDLCCSNPVVTFTSSVLSTCPLVLQGMWIAHDACSNFVEYQETLTIPCCSTNVCMQIGTLTNKTVPCGTNWSFDRPVVLSDVCCTNHQYIYGMQVITNSSSCPQMLTAVWQISDACGDSVNCTQTVTLACCTNTNCVTPPANMVLWLPFDETNGNVSANLQSPLNPGTQVNNPAPWQGQFVDNSLSFSGTNYVTVPDYPAMDIGSNDMTIDAWVYESGPASANPTNIIVSKVSSLYSGSGYALMLETNKGLIFDMNGHFYNENAPILPSGYWHFVAVTLNQSIQLGVFYVDGNAVSYFNPAPPASLSNNDPLWVASAPGAFSVPFINSGVTSWVGALDEVEIYNRALSTNELNSVFNAGPRGKCKPCISILCTNVTVYTCSNCTTVPFSATAVDGCCTNPIVFYNYTTNTCFEVNTTTPVIVMASDDCGHTATNSFTITVLPGNCGTNPCAGLNFTNFTSNAVINASMYLNGSAATAIGAEGTPVLRLTSANSFQAGSAFVPVLLGNSLSFTTEFSFQMTNGGGSLDGTPNPAGADGICFVMASAPTDIGLLGFAGGGVGYQNISSSVAIKFDSWEDGSSGFPQDSDPNGNFVAVYTDGSVETAGYVPYALSNPATEPQYYSPPHPMKNGDIWYAWINYNGASGEMDVYLSDGSSARPATPQLVQTISLDNLSILGPSPELYVGITAATGGAWEDNDVLSWQFASPCTNACLTILCSNIVTHTCAPCTNVQFAASYTDLCCSNATLYYNYPSNYCFQANTTNTVQVVGIDNCGNSATNYFTVTVVPCQESNCLTMSLLTSNLVVYSCSGCVPITFSNGVAYDPGFLANVVAYSDPCCTNVSIAYFPSNYCFAVGSSTPVQVTVYDSCGNMEWQQFNVTVLPGNCQTNCLSSSCPSNVVVTLPCGSSCVTLSNYPPAFATNYCNPTNLTVVYYPPLPNCFPPGETTVYRWVYGSGQSNLCTFDVIVQTNSCSTTNSCIKLNCTNLVAYTCSTNCLIVPLTATAIDTCCTNGSVSLQYYVLVGTNYYDISPTNTCFPVGTTNTVVVVGTDSCGDTASKSFTVTVLNGPGTLAIKYQQLGNNVVLTWSQGILQAMPTTFSPADPRTLMYPWSDVPGATSPYVTKANGATTFYRLRCPCMTCTNCLILNCPTNITVITCAPCTNIPFASYVGVQDNCCTNWNLMFNYPTNYCFPVNTTNTIQVLAMDSCGDVATNSFTVIVLPCANGVTNCLSLNCPGNITVGTCSSTATVNASASIFGCTNGVSLYYVALSGYSSSLSTFPFPVGTTEVTVLANQSGNTVATCYFYVTVTNLNCGNSGPMIQWTFAGSQPNATLAAGIVISNIAPELGTGTASALHHGAATYSSPDGNGSDHSFSANNWTVGDYFQFSCPTANATDIGVAWDQVSSSTGPGLFQLQYSTDGSTFNNAGAPYSVAANNSLSGPSSYWTSSTNNSTTHYEQDLSSISSLANAAQISFRLVDVSSNTPFGATVGQYGTSRVGNFTVTGVQLVGQVPEVTWAAPGPIMYGTPLGDEQLDAMSTVAGTFTYSPPAGTILPVGSNLLTAVFSGPGPHTNTVILVVMPRLLTFSGDNATLTAGQTNTAFTGTILGAIASDNINATWTCTATPVSPPGDYLITPIVTANPGALLNYIITTNPGTGTMPPVGCTCHGVTNLWWTFEVSQPHADEPAGVPITGIFPEFGSGVASALHQATAIYTHPIGDGSTNSFCATNWNVGDYFQFACSNVTLCFNWEVSWDQVSSYTGPGQFQLRYSLDGVNFINIGAPYTVYPNGNLPGSPPYWTAATRNPWTHYVQNLSIISSEPGTPTVWFQLVDLSETSADGKSVYSAGSDRVDNFKLTSTDTGP